MRVMTWSPDCDPAKIDGFTVVVDVLRAFSVSYYIAANSPARYIAVDDVDRAFALREENPGSVLVGERQGITVPGFDYGNSPTEIIDQDFSGRTVIHTTTAGTKGLLAQKDGNEVVVGSFVNAGATEQADRATPRVVGREARVALLVAGHHRDAPGGIDAGAVAGLLALTPAFSSPLGCRAAGGAPTCVPNHSV